MLCVDVADMTAFGEGRNSDHGNARAGAEEIDWLDEAGVVVAAAFVHRDEDGGLGPLLGIGLRELDDVFSEGFEEAPFRGSRVAVKRAVWLDIGDRRERAVNEIGEEVGYVAHVIGNHAGIVGLILEGIADIAIEAVNGAPVSRVIEAVAIIFPGNIVGG